MLCIPFLKISEPVFTCNNKMVERFQTVDPSFLPHSSMKCYKNYEMHQPVDIKLIYKKEGYKFNTRLICILMHLVYMLNHKFNKFIEERRDVFHEVSTNIKNLTSEIAHKYAEIISREIMYFNKIWVSSMQNLFKFILF